MTVAWTAVGVALAMPICVIAWTRHLASGEPDDPDRPPLHHYWRPAVVGTQYAPLTGFCVAQLLDASFWGSVLVGLAALAVGLNGIVIAALVVVLRRRARRAR